jgi:hypothetical protein
MIKHFKFLFTVLFVGVSFVLSAQSLLTGWTGKISYANYALGDVSIDRYMMSLMSDKHMQTLSFDYSKRINRIVDAGVNIGYGIYDEWEVESGEDYISMASVKYSSSLLYGINANVHILPIFMDNAHFRFDVYLNSRVGGMFMFTQEGNVPERGNYFDYAFMGGLAFYITDHFGLYGEYGFGEYANWRTGISLRY